MGPPLLLSSRLGAGGFGPASPGLHWRGLFGSHRPTFGRDAVVSSPKNPWGRRFDGCLAPGSRPELIILPTALDTTSLTEPVEAGTDARRSADSPGNVEPIDSFWGILSG